MPIASAQKGAEVLESYLARAGQEAVRLERYNVQLSAGEMHVALVQLDGWEQREFELEMQVSTICWPTCER